jgi:hypothetical protein
MKSGDFAIFSAIARRDPDMVELEALGRPAFLIVPSAGGAFQLERPRVSDSSLDRRGWPEPGKTGS